MAEKRGAESAEQPEAKKHKYADINETLGGNGIGGDTSPTSEYTIWVVMMFDLVATAYTIGKTRLLKHTR